MTESRSHERSKILPINMTNQKSWLTSRDIIEEEGINIDHCDTKRNGIQVDTGTDVYYSFILPMKSHSRLIFGTFRRYDVI